MAAKVNVYSEIGQLVEVIVQRPGAELRNFDVDKRDQFLMDGDLDPPTAAAEHDKFVQILRENNVKVQYFQDLFIEAWEVASAPAKTKFLKQFLLEAKIDKKWDKKAVEKHLIDVSKNANRLIRVLIEGINAKYIWKNAGQEFITAPLANLYFQRDNFSCLADCVTINKMKYDIRARESLLSEFFWTNHPEYKKTKQVYSRTYKNTIEGGDIFPYTKDTLVVGISERTTLGAVEELAINLKKANNSFKEIVCINVPKVGRLMHLDTWLTMLDTNKFLYSPNAVKDFKFWRIDLTAKTIEAKELKAKNIETVLESIIHQKPIMIPVAGNVNKFAVDRETKYDGTNYLVLRPGVVVGYERNRQTNMALAAAGIAVLTFGGNELSLGEGNARCMSMPIYRKDI